MGHAWRHGQGLHAQARVGAVDDPVEALEEAVALLAESPARLEHARALVALGGALRRRGRRADSRKPLREGYELALGCGAEAEIAQELFLTVKTAEMHLTHAYRKLGIGGRADLAQSLAKKI